VAQAAGAPAKAIVKYCRVLQSGLQASEPASQGLRTPKTLLRSSSVRGDFGLGSCKVFTGCHCKLQLFECLGGRFSRHDSGRSEVAGDSKFKVGFGHALLTLGVISHK